MMTKAWLNLPDEEIMMNPMSTIYKVFVSHVQNSDYYTE